ncbi:MAG: hypothetical protein GEU73_05020 [Chloroflexi bacterium]|nr:hypothetical protein [Chloroflexota bacterium]
MSDALERLKADIDTFLQEAAASSGYEGFDGLLIGWSLVTDRVRPDDDADDDGWYDLIDKPGQRGATTVGHHTLALNRMAGPYIEQGFGDAE